MISAIGGAGDLASNIKRWMGQIKLDVSDQQLEEFLRQSESIKTEGGFIGEVIDFTALQKNEPDVKPSMIAAVIRTSQGEIFVKMTGTKSAVSNHKEEFKALYQSLK